MLRLTLLREPAAPWLSHESLLVVAHDLALDRRNDTADWTDLRGVAEARHPPHAYKCQANFGEVIQRCPQERTSRQNEPVLNLLATVASFNYLYLRTENCE